MYKNTIRFALIFVEKLIFTVVLLTSLEKKKKKEVTMDREPFFTDEEKKLYFSKYKQLLSHLYSFLEKSDVSKMKNLMKRVVALDCYGRDKNGINGLSSNEIQATADSLINLLQIPFVILRDNDRLNTVT